MKLFKVRSSESKKSAAEAQPRTAERLVVNHEITIRAQKNNSQHRALLRDVSIRGARISTDLKMPVGDRISLIIELDSRMSLELCGQIVHLDASQPPVREYGIQYLGLQSADVDLLNRYVTSLEAKRSVVRAAV